jgi:hypothetical protein
MASFNVASAFSAPAPNTPLSRIDPETEARSRQLYALLAQFQQQYGNAQGGQNALGAYLDQVIRGGVPSVAGTQLQQGLQATQHAAMSHAAGVGGPGNALANYAAIQAGGNAAVDTNAQAAQLRAQEIAQAMEAKQRLLAGQAAQAGSMFGTTLTGSNQLQGTVTQGTATEAGEQQDREHQNQVFFGNLVNGIGGAVSRGAIGK